MATDGILLIDKPAGLTSFGVVARVRRVLSQEAGKKVKVGHTGTLDPFATGLLILLTGKETKRSGDFLKLDKWYEATVRLGQVSTTGDPEGEISEYVKNSKKEMASKKEEGEKKGVGRPNKEEVERVIASLKGEIEQRVPIYSAVKIRGRRAYDLARKGEIVKMPVRRVQIYQLEVVEYVWPELKIKCHVSSGTYIRSLGEEIGERLGVGGYLTMLRRTKVGKYGIEQAENLEEWMRKLG